MAKDNVKILQDWVKGSLNYRIRAGIMTGVSVIYTIFVIVTLILFIITSRNKRSGLEKRSVKLVIIQAVGCYLVGVDGLVTAALNDWACFGKLWLFNIGFLMSLTAMSARAFNLMVVYKVHELSSELSMQYPKTMQSGASAMLMKPEEKWYPQNSTRITSTSSSTMDIPDSVPRLRQAKQLEKYKRLLPYVTDKALIIYIAIVIAVGVVLTLVINITDKQFSMRPMSTICIFFWGFLPITAVVVLYFFIIFPIILWRVWRQNDAYGIRNDLIICDTVGILCMVITIVWVNVLKETQQIWPGMSYIWVYAFFIHITSVLIPLVRAMQHIRNSDEQDKQQEPLDVSMMTQSTLAYSIGQGRRAGFNAMLEDPIEYQSFRAFAVSCFCSELTGFIEEYQALKARTVFHFKSSAKDSGLSKMKTNANSQRNASSREDNRKETLSQLRLSQCMIDEAFEMEASAKKAGVTSIHTSIRDAVLKVCAKDKHFQKTAAGEELQFPQAVIHKITAIFYEYVDPNSYASVNATPLVARQIADGVNSNYYPLTMLDDLKNEVLFMLYTDVYSRYIRK
ncbi:hypothetical protein GGI07_001139 [Coemansia sp. Benny D115]|nr:hypothetical protein GGI07_001139 [Coemansia sp. Benny D115]